MRRCRLLLALACISFAACGDDGPDPGPFPLPDPTPDPTPTPDPDPDPDPPEPVTGRFLFEEETFGGNGRTCLTCHGRETGTINPDEVLALFNADPSAPLFRGIDSDDQLGESFSRLIERATILAGVNLADGVREVGNDSRSVLLPRGVPTTLNTPALDMVLMLDGRAPSLAAQAQDAIGGHAEASPGATDEEAALIAEFETTLFSSAALESFANGGPPPALPAPRNILELRGMSFLLPGGLCAGCHGGPMLDTTGGGTRFLSVLVSERNLIGNPVRDWAFTDEAGGETVVSSPDPGRALVTGDIADLNRFKIPTLWGVANTAPYFHDNSALTLRELLDHYDFFFNTRGIADLTERDKNALEAYMRRL